MLLLLCLICFLRAADFACICDACRSQDEKLKSEMDAIYTSFVDQLKKEVHGNVIKTHICAKEHSVE